MQVSPGEVSFQLRSRAVAVGAALETPLPGRFSDNALLVLPWAPLALSFVADGKVAAADLEKSLSIHSVYSSAGAPAAPAV